MQQGPECTYLVHAGGDDTTPARWGVVARRNDERWEKTNQRRDHLLSNYNVMVDSIKVHYNVKLIR